MAKSGKKVSTFFFDHVVYECPLVKPFCDEKSEQKSLKNDSKEIWSHVNISMIWWIIYLGATREKKQDEYSKMAHSLEVAKNSIMKVTIVDIKTDPVRCRRDPVINARLTGFSTRKSGGNNTDQHPSTVGLLNLKLRIKHLFIFVKKKRPRV